MERFEPLALLDRKGRSVPPRSRGRTGWTRVRSERALSAAISWEDDGGLMSVSGQVSGGFKLPFMTEDELRRARSQMSLRGDGVPRGVNAYRQVVLLVNLPNFIRGGWPPPTSASPAAWMNSRTGRDIDQDEFVFLEIFGDRLDAMLKAAILFGDAYNSVLLQEALLRPDSDLTIT